MSRPIERWVVVRPEPLDGVLQRLGSAGLVACADGRVFVDGRRALAPDQVLSAGAVVEVYAPRPRVSGVTVLAEHDGLVYVEKPPGVATEPDRSGTSACVLAEVAALLGAPEGSLHALSRLDVGVSGVVLVGRDSEACRRVQALRENGQVRRRYVAIAAGAPEPDRGVWAESIAKLGRGPRRGPPPGQAGSSAATRYAVVDRVQAEGSALPRRRAGGPLASAFALLALEPITGRTHQIRVHAALHGAPLLGDRTYGGPTRLTLPNGEVRPIDRVYLHASWVEMPGAPRISSRLPAELRAAWTALGGSAAAIDAAAAVVEFGDPERPGDSGRR